MRTLSCKHKICDKTLVHCSPDLTALNIFNDLETCRPNKLMITLAIVKFKRKFIERFPDNYHISRRIPNYIEKWKQEHLNAHSPNPFFSQSAKEILINFLHTILNGIKTESTRKSSNIYLSWTKIEYQNNLNPIALFSTLNKR